MSPEPQTLPSLPPVEECSDRLLPPFNPRYADVGETPNRPADRYHRRTQEPISGIEYGQDSTESEFRLATFNRVVPEVSGVQNFKKPARAMTIQDGGSSERRLGRYSDPVNSSSVEIANDPIRWLTILLGIAVVLGSVVGWFLTSRGESDAPVMSMVPQEQLSEAIPTLSPASQRIALSKFRQCLYPIAVITASTPGNPAGGTVSFRTSSYVSPKFHITDKPQQIAIPNPLPETGGLDTLSVDGEAKGLIVSLYPTAGMEPFNGTKTIPVRWHPRPPCK